MRRDKPEGRPTSMWWRTVGAVLWGFLGVRRGSDYQQDIRQLRPLPLLVVGVLLALLFVLGLMALAHWAAT